MALRLAVWFLVLLIGSHGVFGQQTDKDTRLLPDQNGSFFRNSLSITNNYDIRYHRLEIEVDPDVHYIDGMVCTWFVPLTPGFSTIQFDFYNNMTIDSVVYNGIHLFHSFPNSTTLEIQFPGPLPQNELDSVRVYYQGAPHIDGFGSFETGQSDCYGDHPIMWTLSEPYGAKTWWPCKETLDDKIDSVDVIVTTPAQYRVGSNGLLVNEIQNGNLKTYSWKHRYPIPAYLVAFAVAEYSVYSDFVPIPGTSEEIEILNYVFPCNLASAQSKTPDLIPIFQYFIETFGPYPYENEKYGHAECGFGGGMEHSTMSFMGSFGVSLMAHELAHQWFGNKITCGTWNDIWLNEGFATYLDGLSCEEGIGYTSWSNWKSSKINHVTSNNYGSTYVYNTNNVYSIFNSRLVYSKGALILHMLRWKLGDDDFFNAVLNYISDPMLAYDYAVTNDLKTHLEQVSGQDLTEFFADWLYGEGWPNYTVEWAYSQPCEKVYVKILQNHSANQGTFFEMPLPIKFSNGSESVTLVFEQDSPDKLEFFVALDFEPTTVQFDPEKWICAKSTVNQISLPDLPTTWTGAVNNFWTDPGNWDCGLPNQDTDAVIPADTPHCILRSFEQAECRSLHVDPNATLITEKESVLILFD
jgi:aminopeptidase N